MIAKEECRCRYEDPYDQSYNMFSSLISQEKSSYDVRSSFLDFARFLVPQFFDKSEDENREAIRKASAHIVEYGETILRFISKSRIKTASALTGQYEFTVTMQVREETYESISHQGCQGCGNH